jgi:hypothetical protein
MFKIISPSRFGYSTGEVLPRAKLPQKYKTGKKEVPNQRSDVQRLKPVFEYLAKMQTDLGVSCADRADIIIREILKFRAGFNAMMRFPAFLIIDIIAHGAKITGGMPFLKAPLPDLSLSLHAADRAEIVIREVLKGCTGRNAIMRFAPEG